MLSKIVGWVVNTPLHDAQRALIEQQTRRLRLKTDLQERRIKERLTRIDKEKALEEEFNSRHHPKAEVRLKLRHSGRKAYVVYTLLASKKERLLRRSYIVIENKPDGDSWNRFSTSDFPSCVEFVERSGAYTLGISGWLNGTLELDELKTLLDEYDSAKITLLEALINKKKD